MSSAPEVATIRLVSPFSYFLSRFALSRLYTMLASLGLVAFSGHRSRLLIFTNKTSRFDKVYTFSFPVGSHKCFRLCITLLLVFYTCTQVATMCCSNLSPVGVEQFSLSAPDWLCPANFY